MAGFAVVTEADLARARREPAFRQRLLRQSLETLLAGMQKLRNSAPSGTGASAAATATQMREAVELAVRLAELIQSPEAPSRGNS